MPGPEPLSVYGRFLEAVRNDCLVPRGSRVLVALSGGADSVCLLDLFLAARRALAVDVRAMHINHRLRTSAADDEAFVRKLCAARHVKVDVVRRDVRRFARVRGLSIEEAGREIRYRELERGAHRQGCARVALGHNSEDSLETMLLNIARGTGLAGVAGIPLQRGLFIRPLLDIGRDSIRHYLRARGQRWIEDESNADPAYRRNIIRQQALPALLNVNPAAAANARRLARVMGLEDRFLDRAGTAALAAVLDRPGGNRVDILRLARYDEVLQRRALRLRFPALDMAAVDRVLELARGRAGRALDLGHGIRARRAGDWLVFDFMEDWIT